MPRLTKPIRTLVVLGAVFGVASAGVLSAYVAQTTNAGNSVTAGTVQLGDNDANAALFPAGSFGNVGPADPAAVRCLKVDWSGSLNSTAKVFASATPTNGTNFRMKIERGTSTVAGTTFPNCPAGGDTAWDGAALFDNTLDTVATTYAGGYPLKSGGNVLTGGNAETVWLRFTMTVVDDTTPNAHTTPVGTGAHSWVIEARSN